MVYQAILNKKRNISAPLQAKADSRTVRYKTHSKRVYMTIPVRWENAVRSGQQNRGSAAVEASLVVPLFLMTIFVFYTICNLFQVKMLIYEAMQETAQYLAEYQYAGKLAEDALNETSVSETTSSGMTVNVLTAGLQFRACLENEALVSSYVDGGKNGILFTRASYQTSNGCIYLKLRYRLKAEIPLFGTLTWESAEKIYQKAYVGRIREDGQTDDDAYVYIAETGDVYHSSRSCTHIQLSIRQIDAAAIAEQQEHLLPCEYCAKGKKTEAAVYITDTGNRYHNSLSCSGLKRTITRVTKKDAGNLPPCSQCGQ